jgi:tetratricopeptide (TPR) repeat protein
MARATGANQTIVAMIINNLTLVYQGDGNYVQAEDYCRRALAHEKKEGADQPRVAEALHNLAVVYQAEGKYAEASEILPMAEAAPGLRRSARKSSISA